MELPVTGADDLIRMLAGDKIGRTVEIEALRNGEPACDFAGAGRAGTSRLIDRRLISRVSAAPLLARPAVGERARS